MFSLLAYFAGMVVHALTCLDVTVQLAFVIEFLLPLCAEYIPAVVFGGLILLVLKGYLYRDVVEDMQFDLKDRDDQHNFRPQMWQ